VLRKVRTFSLRVKKSGFSTALRYFFHKYYYKFLLSRTNLNKERIIETNGCKLALIPNDLGISAELALFKIHEPLHTKLLIKKLDSGMVCVEVGANIGYYALLESKLVGESGKVICIEPSPINFQYLTKNIKLQNLKNLEVHNLACGEKDGIIKFLVSNHSNWSRVMNKNEKIETDDLTKIIDIPIKKLDTFLKEKNELKIDLIRMDIEGYEFNAMKGMIETIEKHSPMLVIEFHNELLGVNKTKDLLNQLKNKNYVIDYVVDRDLDVPLVGTQKDIKKISFEKLDKMLDQNDTFRAFTLFLSNSNRKS